MRRLATLVVFAALAGSVPAAVVNGSIRIEGMCPDEGTLNNALRAGGLCLK